MQMNLPGSVIGAWSRAFDAGTVTHSVIPAIASWAATPPSRKARVLEGTRAAAISWARTTPRRVSVAASDACRSAMRSPWSAPRRGDWPLVEKRTSFMGEGLPSENYGQLYPFHGVRWAPGACDILFVSRDRARETRRDVMRLLARSIALAVVLSLLLSGPVAPLAAAQQP